MSIYRAQHRLLGTHVRYWPLTKIVSSTPPVRIRGLSRYQLCGGPFHCICPLMTQSGHGSAVGSHTVLCLHLLVSIDQEVVEILNANESEPRIFHVSKGVQRHRQ